MFFLLYIYLFSKYNFTFSQVMTASLTMLIHVHTRTYDTNKLISKLYMAQTLINAVH